MKHVLLTLLLLRNDCFGVDLQANVNPDDVRNNLKTVDVKDGLQFNSFDGSRILKRTKRQLKTTTSDGTIINPCRDYRRSFSNETDSDFCRLLLYDSDDDYRHFVDKSLFLREFLTAAIAVTEIKRPDGWGKTVNTDMLDRFLRMRVDDDGNPLRTTDEENVDRKLFFGGRVTIIDGKNNNRSRNLKPLKIAEYPDTMDYQGRHPVIRFGFKNVVGDSYAEIERKLKDGMRNLFLEYDYLTVGDYLTDYDRDQFRNYTEGRFEMFDLKNAIHFLSRLLRGRYRKYAFVLIEDYDAPINRLYLKRDFDRLTNNCTGDENERDLELTISLIDSILTKAVWKNVYIRRGLLTAAYMNNLSKYRIYDEKLCRHFGFTDTEVGDLIERSINKNNNNNNNLERIRNWYGGYRFGIGQTVHYPFSVIRYSRNGGKFDYYYYYRGDKPNDARLIRPRLVSRWFRPTLHRLLIGREIRVGIYDPIRVATLSSTVDKSELLANFLLLFGYLGPVDKEYDLPNGPVCSVEAVNELSKRFYEVTLEEILDNELKQDSSPVSDLLSSNEARVEEFRNRLQSRLVDYLNETDSLSLSMSCSVDDDYGDDNNSTTVRNYDETIRLYKTFLKSYLKSPGYRISEIIRYENDYYSDGRILLTIRPTNTENISGIIVSGNTATGLQRVERIHEDNFERVRNYRERSDKYATLSIVFAGCTNLNVRYRSPK